MAKRKNIPQKVRFEVFKRDSFKCQYCGGTSPDILLEVDHIKPVKEGGDNDITNLITSCQACNSGKGARLLDDDSVLKKQRQQLEDLNERRQQLEMMMEWRDSLKDIDNEAYNMAHDYYANLTGYTLTDLGEKELRQNIKKYGLNSVLDAIDCAIDQYAVRVDDHITADSIRRVFKMVGKICHVKTVDKEKPYFKDLLYIRGIVRNRMYCDNGAALRLLEMAYVAGASIQSLKDVALTARKWGEFEDTLREFIEEHGGV